MHDIKHGNIMLQYALAFLFEKRKFNFLLTFLQRFSKRNIRHAAVNKCIHPALLVHKQCIHGKFSEEFRSRSVK